MFLNGQLQLWNFRKQCARNFRWLHKFYSQAPKEVLLRKYLILKLDLHKKFNLIFDFYINYISN